MSTPVSELPSRAVERALRELAAGKMIVVRDDNDRENEGDLVMSAEHATPDAIGFMIRYTSGILCVPMTGERIDALELAPMVAGNNDPHQTAFTVSVDAVGTGTGISAADRCATVRALADFETQPAGLRRPGHVFPLRSRPGGVLKRAGHTEAAVDLMTLAGLKPVAVISELVNDDGSVSTPEEVERFAADHRLAVLDVADLIQFRRLHDQIIERSGDCTLPTAWGDFHAVAYRSTLDGTEHLAITLGDVTYASSNDPVLVRVHSECLTGDILSSRRCDCGPQLDEALRLISAEGRGALIYLRGHEGRGIGLGHKLRAYSLQDQGHDTVDANLALGLPVDSREYGVGAAMLADLGVRRLSLLTNNPAKLGGLEGYDLDIVGRRPLVVGVSETNLEYLRTKRDRLGHQLDNLEIHTGGSR